MVESSELEMVTIKTTLPAIPYTPVGDRKPIYAGRLLLRPLTLDDAAELYETRSQPEVMQWTARGTPDVDAEQTREYLKTKLPPHDATNYDYAICLASTGAIIGHGGVHRRQGELGWPEFGYLFRKEAWGKGYATEFVKAILASYWDMPRTEVETEVDRDTVAGEGDLKEECLAAVTVTDNEASQKVLKKNNLELVKVWEEPDLRDKTKQVTLYGWVAKKPSVVVG